MNVLGESERGRSELTFMLVKVGELLDDGDGMPLLFDPYNLNSKPSVLSSSLTTSRDPQVQAFGFGRTGLYNKQRAD